MISREDRTTPSTAAFAFLCLLALLVGLTGWLFTSAIVSFVNPAGPDTVEYLLVARSAFELAPWTVGALAFLVAWQTVCACRLFRLSRWQDAFGWPSVAPLAPLLLLALPLGAVALLAAPLVRASPPWDLSVRRPPVVAPYGHRRTRGGCDGRTLRKNDGAARAPGHSVYATRLGAPDTGNPPGWRARILTEGSLRPGRGRRRAEVPYATSRTGTRGRGTDIDNLVPIQKLPVDYQPQPLRNFRHAAEAISTIAADLASDARRLAGLPAPPRPGPAVAHGDAFVQGKRGGVYQVHNPGLSLLLFPGYFLDRFALNWTSHSFAQGPAHLYATSVALLSMYLLWGVALYRFLTSQTNNRPLSFAVACTALLSLPATAFAYQYYPEVAGGLLLAVVARYVAFTNDARFWPAFEYGALAGYLPWLHVRFGYAAIVAGTLMAVGRMRSSRQAVLGFWTGVLLPIGALCLYSYHITGSLLPFKVWEVMLAVDPSTHVVHPAVARRFVGLWLDVDSGLVSHAPVYALALSGLWPLWRRSRRLTGIRGAFRRASRAPISRVQLARQRHDTFANCHRGCAAARDPAGGSRPALPAVAMVSRHMRRARGNLHRQRLVVQPTFRPRPAGARGTNDRRVAEPPGFPAPRHSGLADKSTRALLDCRHSDRSPLAGNPLGAGHHAMVMVERDGDGSHRHRVRRFGDWRVDRRAASYSFPRRLPRGT